MQSIYIAIVCALLLYGIIKKLLPQGLLFLAGFALLGATVIMGWGHGTIPVKAHTGSVFDFFALLKQIFFKSICQSWSGHYGYEGLLSIYHILKLPISS